MTKDEIIKLLIEVLLFLAASYLIFYKSLLKYIGKETAKSLTIADLTRLKEEVSSEFSKELEKIKSVLAKKNISYQIQFNYLHQEKAKATLEIYRNLQELQSAMLDWTALMHPVFEDAELEEKARSQRANKAIQEFKNHYILNKVFFPKEFCDYIDSIFKEYWDKGWDFGYKKNRIKNLKGDFYKYYSDELKRISEEIRETLPAKIEEIELECKKILLIEENK